VTDDTALAHLAALAGIGAGYHDIWGGYRETGNDTRRALLRAMGIESERDEDVHAAIAEREQRAWRRMLPPVQVVRATGHGARVPLTVAADDAARPLRWRLVAESGAVHEGTAVPAELPETARGEADGTPRLRVSLALSVDPGLGYHQFEVTRESGRAVAAMCLIVCPEECFVPRALRHDGRIWAMAVQLYALRGERDWGMGDFTTLGELAETCRQLGADGVGLNPLHALSPHDPGHCAPYSPSSRLFLNMLYIDPLAVPELAECPRAAAQVREAAFQEDLDAARASERIDYGAVAALKRPVLEALFETFRQSHMDRDTGRGRAFARFREARGERLRRHALFEALQEHLAAGTARSRGWLDWPAAYRDPHSPEVSVFAATHAHRVAFFEYLQWLADEQLTAAAARARDAGLALGLYLDLAVSVDGHGAEAWGDEGLYARGASVGAPPDDFNLNGQDWSLPPMVPERLVDAAYAPFIATLRSNMRHAGALRIDHAMGLFRLYWVPAGQQPDRGAYVHYPLEDLLGILALESQRNRCMVIGEDLGTVPDEVRGAFAPAEVHSYRVLYFEKHGDGAFRAPGEYPRQALATVGTHDLPPLHGYWTGRDLALRTELDLYPTAELRDRQVAQREHDRNALLAALAREGLLPEGTGTEARDVPDLDAPLRRAVHRYLARAPSRVMMVQPEDVTGRGDPANLPGTTNGYPNWRRRHLLSATAMAADAEFRATAAALAEEGRGRAPLASGKRARARKRKRRTR